MNTPPPGRILVTVAICTRNRAQRLATSVGSVLPQLDAETELLIVDNASSDATPEMAAALAARHPSVRVCCATTPGIAAARNAALRSARAEYVLFFDDDELAEPGWLDAYRAFLRTQPPKLGCVGGPYLAHHEAPLPDWLEPHYGEFNLGSEQHLLTDKTSPAGGNCAYPRAVALQAGGFAEELVRHEDSELNDRLRAAGFNLWWLPSARVRHVIPAERFRLKAQMRLWFSEGQSIVAVRLRQRRHSRLARSLFLIERSLVTPAQIVAQLLAAGVCAIVGCRPAATRLFLRATRSAGVLRQVVAELQPFAPREK